MAYDYSAVPNYIAQLVAQNQNPTVTTLQRLANMLQGSGLTDAQKQQLLQPIINAAMGGASLNTGANGVQAAQNAANLLRQVQQSMPATSGPLGHGVATAQGAAGPTFTSNVIGTNDTTEPIRNTPVMGTPLPFSTTFVNTPAPTYNPTVRPLTPSASAYKAPRASAPTTSAFNAPATGNIPYPPTVARKKTTVATGGVPSMSRYLGRGR